MAVTSLNGTEQTIAAFVQDIIRYARQKVEKEQENENRVGQENAQPDDMSTSGHLCNGDATEDEVRIMVSTLCQTHHKFM